MKEFKIKILKFKFSKSHAASTTVYDYAVQATPTYAENKISRVFTFAHTARFRIMRKFGPFKNFPLYGNIIHVTCDKKKKKRSCRDLNSDLEIQSLRC